MTVRLPHHRRRSIYQSRLHLLVTFLFIAFPLVFLLVFAQLTKVTFYDLITNIGWSAYRLFIAYLIAVILAWVLAVLFYRGRRALVALPIFDVLQSFPTFAMLPLVTLVWGASDATIILFLVITVIWPIFFSVISSLKLIKNDWDEVAAVYRLTGWPYLTRFLLPVSVPGVITGSIIGLGEGWEALIATEIIVGIKTGLGPFFQAYATNPLVTALGIIAFLLIIFSVNKLIWLPLLEWSHQTMEE